MQRRANICSIPALKAFQHCSMIRWTSLRIAIVVRTSTPWQQPEAIVQTRQSPERVSD
jgi:hypothetical protein